MDPTSAICGLPVQPFTIPAEGSVKRVADCCGIEVWVLPDDRNAERVICPGHISDEVDSR